MLSTVSPQRAVVSLHTGQLTTPPLFNHKQPVMEAAVPVQLHHLLRKCYGFEEGADLYIIPNNPNKLFVFYRGQLRMVDLSAWQAIQQPFSNDDLKVSPKSSLEDGGGNGRVVPPVTPVTPRRTPSTIAHRVNEPEWHKAVSDKERELLQKERRRKSAYKTSLCNAFRDTGQCAYGLECRFAHGIDELRPTPGPHPKYKTQLCNKFALYGSCPYGSRCQFIHMRPYEVQNDLVHMNFTASLDDGGKHALHYRHYSRGTRPRYCATNSCVVEVTGSERCDSFSQQYFNSDNNLQTVGIPSSSCNSEAVQTFWHQYRPNADVAGNVERTLSAFSMAGSNGLNSDITAVDDLFSTMSIGELNNPFTQSCFPRINLETVVGRTRP
ncbi:Zinc finger C-x8-C-x5-C-x3-H type (and similar) family protein [Acanthocheilonema viteae]